MWSDREALLPWQKDQLHNFWGQGQNENVFIVQKRVQKMIKNFKMVTGEH